MMSFLATFTSAQLSIFVISIVVFAFIMRWHMDVNTKLSFIDVITDAEGNFSLFRTGQACALVLSSWYFVVAVDQNKMTMELFTVYMGMWSGSNLINKWLSNQGAPNATK